MLAAADEASYDLSPTDLAEALAGESSSGLHPGAPQAARTALQAAHAVYENSFGHAFLVCLDGHPEEEYVDRTLAAIRERLSHEPEEERVVAADELRRMARARVARMVTGRPVPRGDGRLGYGCPGGPSFPV